VHVPKRPLRALALACLLAPPAAALSRTVAPAPQVPPVEQEQKPPPTPAPEPAPPPAETPPVQTPPVQTPPAETPPIEAPPQEPSPVPPERPETGPVPEGKPQEPPPGAKPEEPPKEPADSKDSPADPESGHSVTRHSISIGEAQVEYTARAGTLELKEESGKEKAHVFFVAYTRDGETDLAKRPITFSFNGGPGSSSVWLHLGALGPRRVRLSEEGWPPPPPYELVDNEGSWLDLTDLVFIDPVTTGYSRPAEGESGEQFHGVTEDVQAVGEFIRLYTTRYRRWASPKFLAGESYGTTRAAGLAGHLQERHGMYLNGIVLVSSILNFQTARFDRGNDLPYVLYLPSYTAAAWYHKRLAPELQGDLRAALDEAEMFARGEYASALLAGDDLSSEERERLVAKLGRYTGLSLDFIERSNLRVEMGRFAKELLRDQRRTVGRLDSRFQGIDLDAAGQSYEYDPSYAAILGPFTGALNHYVRVELGYESDLPYEILTGRVHPWKFGESNRYLNVADTLRQAMTRNPALRVFVACGYYDLATPYYAAEYTFDHLGLDPTLRGHVTFAHYESGHMMYIHQGSLARLKQDVAAFLRPP
jgi:carboxypeptidase C (cathepsin A)